MNGDECKLVVFGWPSFFKEELPDLNRINIGDKVFHTSTDVKYLGV